MSGLGQLTRGRASENRVTPAEWRAVARIAHSGIGTMLAFGAQANALAARRDAALRALLSSRIPEVRSMALAAVRRPSIRHRTLVDIFNMAFQRLASMPRSVAASSVNGIGSYYSSY